jgi:tetratricopeptide (TPR) repeat protein
METVTSDLKAGLARHQNGDLAGAEEVYRSILEESPDHAGAWHLLGLISFAKRQYEQAKTEIERALAVCDTKAVYWNNYGATLRELGLIEEAKAACERALAIRPEYADALCNLARCLQDQGSSELAYGRFREALEIQPDHEDALHNLARLCQELDRRDEAIHYYERFTESCPSSGGGLGGPWEPLQGGQTHGGGCRGLSAGRACRAR